MYSKISNTVLAGDINDSRSKEVQTNVDVEAGLEVSMKSDKEIRRAVAKEKGKATWTDIGLHKMNKFSNSKFKGTKAKAGARQKKTGLDKLKQLTIEGFISKTKESNQKKSHGRTKIEAGPISH